MFVVDGGCGAVGRQAQAQVQAQTPAPAQTQAPTADELVEKHLAALGGRSALTKLESRIARGTVSIRPGRRPRRPGGDLRQGAEQDRTYFRVDLSQFGAGELVVDQRCDGKTAFVSNSMTGDRRDHRPQLRAC